MRKGSKWPQPSSPRVAVDGLAGRAGPSTAPQGCGVPWVVMFTQPSCDGVISGGYWAAVAALESWTAGRGD